jgi:geranylgeranyl transferase type-2 subunit beta
MADPFHTLFGIAGLSLINAFPKSLKEVNPVYCLPQNIIDKLNLDIQMF